MNAQARLYAKHPCRFRWPRCSPPPKRLTLWMIQPTILAGSFPSLGALIVCCRTRRAFASCCRVYWIACRETLLSMLSTSSNAKPRAAARDLSP